MPDSPFRPAWWLPGAHLQTLWGKFARRGEPPATRVERWATPDDDFVDVHRLAAPGRQRDAPRLVLLHGLEGTERSHYARGLFAEAARRGWAADLLVFRSCGPELNRARRFYHSGETGDLSLVVRRVVAEHPDAPLALVGVSLGGNVLLKYLGERGDDVPPTLRAAAAISVPFDLARGSRHIERGFSRVYGRHFLRSLRRKAVAKGAVYPDLPPAADVERVRTLWEFDDRVTAPIHGFTDAADYYARSSALGYLAGIRVPTLLVSAEDDPFLPADVLGEVREIARGNEYLRTSFHAHGGHVGFVGGPTPGRAVFWAEQEAARFVARHVTNALPTTAGHR